MSIHEGLYSDLNVYRWHWLGSKMCEELILHTRQYAVSCSSYAPKGSQPTNVHSWIVYPRSSLGHTALLLSTRMHYSSPLGSRCIGYESTYWEALRVWVLCHSQVGVVLVIFWESLYQIFVLYLRKICHKSKLSWICIASYCEWWVTMWFGMILFNVEAKEPSRPFRGLVTALWHLHTIVT